MRKFNFFTFFFGCFIFLPYLCRTANNEITYEAAENHKIYYESRERENYFEQRCKDQEAFMVDIFGEEEADGLYPEDKAKIREFVQSLFSDAEEDEENDER